PLGVTSAFGIDELVGVAFILEDSCQPGVRDHPVASPFGGCFGTIVVLRNLDPHSKRLLFASGEEVLDVFIGAEWGYRTVAKVDESPGIGEDAVIEVRAEP